jgi:hypothetical protein
MRTKHGRLFDPDKGYVELSPFIRILRGRTIRVDAFFAATIWGMNSVTSPKVGITLHSSSCDVFFNEWETGFANAYDYYKLADHLPKDWYLRAERGEHFRIKLTENSA